MEDKQVLPDKIEIDLKISLKMIGCKNNIEKDVTLNVRKKPANVLIIKQDIEIITQEKEKKSNSSTLFKESKIKIVRKECIVD